MRVKIKDREWPSLRQAAIELKCSPATIQSYLDRGAEDLLLEGKRIKKPGYAFTIDGVTYPSAAAAGRAIGKTHTYILRKYGANK